MDSPGTTDQEATGPRHRVPLSLFLTVSILFMVAAGAAVLFAVRAADAAANTELLMDGVDRSRLPVEEAVALARLAQSRSDPFEPEHGDHDHGSGHDAMVHLSPDEEAALADQLATAAERVPEFDTPEEALAAGYVRASGETDGVGSHWVKWSIVDRPFDPAEPSMLLFDELKWGEGERLIAYSYWVASPEAPEGFTGPTDEWHRHLGICFENGLIVTDNIPSDRCDGDWINGSDLWMLHAWIVPGVENADGQFATVNRKLCERACGLEN